MSPEVSVLGSFCLCVPPTDSTTLVVLEERRKRQMPCELTKVTRYFWPRPNGGEPEWVKRLDTSSINQCNHTTKRIIKGSSRSHNRPALEASKTSFRPAGIQKKKRTVPNDPAGALPTSQVRDITLTWAKMVRLTHCVGEKLEVGMLAEVQFGSFLPPLTIHSQASSCHGRYCRRHPVAEEHRSRAVMVANTSSAP